MLKSVRIKLIIIVIVVGVILITAAPALAREGAPVAEGVDFTGLLPAMVMLLLPLGLMLLISSAVPEEDAPAMAITLLMTWGVTALAYFGVGFAFQFGGIAQVSPRPDLSGLYWEWYPLDQSVDAEVARLWGVIALQGWALSGEAITPGALRLFLSHLSLAGVTAMIPVGALLRPVRAIGALLIGLVTGTLIYPLVGNWIWGGGWLANLGTSLGLGHGLVDFGGSTVIFLTGSVVALAALILLKPKAGPNDQAEPAEVVVSTGLDRRLTVYEEIPDSPEEVLPVTPMPSAYLPLLSILGSGLLLLGWVGLTTGTHTPTALNFSPDRAAVNGLLAALSAAVAAAGYSWFTTRRLNSFMTPRGLVAGLGVVMAGAPFIPTWLAVGAGLVMGLLLPLLIYLFDQGVGLEDELGLLATFGISAMISLFLVAFFADGRAGQGWNGLGSSSYLGLDGQGVSGLVVAPGLASDWPGQFQAQLLGLAVTILWTLLISFLLFQAINLVTTAWSRSGLELVDRSLPPPTAGEPIPAEPAVEEVREDGASLEPEAERPVADPPE